MKKITYLFVILSFAMIASSSFAQKFENLAPTPPMGWNSWNNFHCDVSEDMIREITDAMVSSGLADVGYQYIVIDDCWHGERDAQGFIHENPKTFPTGMKALGDYVHSKGLKFGIYSCGGHLTCAGYPASRGHEYQDAITYASWGVDFLKYDWCNSYHLDHEGSYMTMRDALYATGRPILFSICEWGKNQPWNWANKYGQMWRTTYDIHPVFEGLHYSIYDVMSIVDQQDSLRYFAGPNGWNDPDMLEVGNGMTLNEDRSHFTLWCMLAAPLMLGNDLRNMSQETLDILKNTEVIAIDQDVLGFQGWRVSSNDYIDLYVKPLKDNSWAVCYVNRGNQAKQITIDWSQIVIKDDFTKRILDPSTQLYSVRDVWQHKDLGKTDKKITLTIDVHDVFCTVLKAL